MKAKGLMLLTILALTVSVVLVGCKKKEQPAPSPEAIAENVQKQAEEMKETVAAEMEDEKEELERIGKENMEIIKEMEAEAAQTMCPAMDGNPIDPNVFVDYKGKRIFFCCPSCKAKFEANPEKYTAKLPQFRK